MTSTPREPHQNRQADRYAWLLRVAQILRWLCRWRLWTKNVAASAQIIYIKNTAICCVTTTTVSAITCYLRAVSTFSPSITLHFVSLHSGHLQTTLVAEPREISRKIQLSSLPYGVFLQQFAPLHTLTAVCTASILCNSFRATLPKRLSQSNHCRATVPAQSDRSRATFLEQPSQNNRFRETILKQPS